MGIEDKLNLPIALNYMYICNLINRTCMECNILRYVLTILTALLAGGVCHSAGISGQDTVTRLRCVDVHALRDTLTGTPDKYSGGNVQKVNGRLLSSMQNTSLASFLSIHTPVFVKESGNGMLSTVSLRGTSSSHTVVDWDGLPINSLTMGQVDFSEIPLFFFDGITVVSGGESSLYGSGAIGGSISLRNYLPFSDTLSGQVQQTVGSYGSSFTGGKLNACSKRWMSSSSAFYGKSDNDFHFQIHDFDGTHSVLQRNAAYHNYGMFENLGYKIDNRQQLNLKLWHTYYYRDIQPSIQNNADTSKYEDISDRTTRFTLDYDRKGQYSLNSTVAYINDHQEYQRNVIATQDFILASWLKRDFYWRSLLNPMAITAGFHEQYIRPDVYSYRSGVDEWRSDFYVNSRTNIKKGLTLLCGLRQQLVTGEHIPFVYSVGASYTFYGEKHNYDNVKFHANISRNYKVPTLNDRYWGDLDNTYLKPEDGLNCEAGLNINFGLDPKDTLCVVGTVEPRLYKFLFAATIFHNDVSNWILWMPRGNVWKPINVDEVLAKGVELSVGQQFRPKHWYLFQTVSYTYSHTEVLKGFAEMRPFQGRQIALIPEHTFSLSLIGQYKGWGLVYGCSYSGERSTSDVYDVMPSYVVMNVSASYEFRLLRRGSLNLSFSVNNLCDTDYQTVPYKAMPGRNYGVTGIVKW